MNKKLYLISLCLLIFFSLSFKTILAKDNINENFVLLIKKMLTQLDKTTFKGEEFDYGLGNGGMRTTYSHLQNFISYQLLSKQSPVDIFLSGPHSPSQLSLNSNYSFGHYNPVFLTWVQKNINQVLKSKKFIRKTKPLVKKYLSKFLLTYQNTQRYLIRHPQYARELLADYKLKIKNKTLPKHYYQSWDTKVVKSLNRRYDGNIINSATYFWLRRSIDGTVGQFSVILNKLVRVYGLR